MDDKKKATAVVNEETNTDIEKINTAPAAPEGPADPAKPSAPVAPLSPWEDKTRIHLFKDDGKYSGDMFVAVNGRSFQIQRGIDVDVPRCVADVIGQSERQDRAASMLMEKLVREYEQATK